MVTVRFSARLVVAVLVSTLAGCGKVQEVRNEVNAVAAATKVAAEMEHSLADAQVQTDARRVKGDTLALPYKELQTYLPAQVAGYKPDGDPEGATMNMTGMSYSTCAQTYRTGEGDNPKTLKVTIIDYNGAAAMYTSATAVLGSGFSMEDDQQRVQGLDLGHAQVKALETFHKQEHRATITAGVSNRFFVTVEADQQTDTDLVKQVVQQMSLPKLAAL